MQGTECMMEGAGCRVQNAGCRVQGAGCRVQGALYHAEGRRVVDRGHVDADLLVEGLSVKGVWFMVHSSRFRVEVQGGLRVEGAGFRVQG